MPEVQADGIQVADEEERYLRRVFRRFALPYIVLTAVLAAGGAWMLSGSSPGDPARAVDPAAVEELRVAAETLKGELAKIAQRVEAVHTASSGAVQRIDALEQEVEASASASSSTGVDPAELAELRLRVDQTRQRVNAFEARLAAGSAQAPQTAAIETLGQRLGSLEERFRRLEEGGSSRPHEDVPAAPAAPGDSADTW